MGPLSCLAVTFEYCDEAVGWIKMPLGTEVGLGPGHTVLDGDPGHPHGKGHSSPPLFGPCLLWPNDRPSQQLLNSCTNNIGLRAYYAVDKPTTRN